MPAKKKTRADRQREQFRKMLAVGKAVTQMTDADIAEFLGVSPPTFWKKKKDPSKLTVGELTKMAALMRWNDEDVIQLFKIS